jgi:tetratricopeptide (TPR) repeat protein
MKSLGFNNTDHFARLFLASRDYASLQKLIDENRTKNKTSAAYYAALMYLAQNDVAKAQKELTILETPESTKPDPAKATPVKTPIAKSLPVISQLANTTFAQADDKTKPPPKEGRQEKKVNEVRGLVLCKTGHVDQGLAILKKLADSSKSNYEQHAWGHGAYYMETWGLAALAAGKEAVAEEAFLEAIAHDPGSFHGVLGMQILCERTGRTDEARQYQAMAQKAWQHAELKTFLDEVANVRSQKPNATLSTSAGQ